ncbi:hypothetical protein Tco_0943496 [Tanacetum coccineum]
MWSRGVEPGVVLEILKRGGRNYEEFGFRWVGGYSGCCRLLELILVILVFDGLRELIVNLKRGSGFLVVTKRSLGWDEDRPVCAILSSGSVIWLRTLTRDGRIVVWESDSEFGSSAGRWISTSSRDLDMVTFCRIPLGIVRRGIWIYDEDVEWLMDGYQSNLVRGGTSWIETRMSWEVVEPPSDSRVGD